MELVAPERVVDVGCGTGTWLRAFLAHGATEIRGVDGAHVPTGDLEIPPKCFRAADLAEPIAINGRYDLAICLEVAEHLPPERGPGLVADLVAMAPVVLFSAAIPGQGGTGHVNERWQDEWAAEFAGQGYVALDVIRPRVWSDPEIDWWYAQNTLLFVSPDSAVELSEQDPGAPPLRTVHPRGFQKQARNLTHAVRVLEGLPEVRLGRRARAMLSRLRGRTRR